MDGESRKAYKSRVHASIRSVNKGGKPILSAEKAATNSPQQKGILKTRPVVKLKPRDDGPSASSKPPPKKQTTKTIFRAKIALKSREKKEREQMDRLWRAAEPERERPQYRW